MKLVIVVLFAIFSAVFLYSYFLYPLILRFFAGIFYHPTKMDGNYTPTLAIVVPVYNEEKIIVEKIENVFSLHYPKDKLSLWIGSDCSTDRTEDLVRRYVGKGVFLYKTEKRSGKVGVLNHIVPNIEAEIVVFTDADIMLDPDSIRHIVKHFADSRVGGVAANTLQVQAAGNNKKEASEEQHYRSFEAGLKLNESKLHSTISAFGSFYAIRKALFVEFRQNTYSNDDVMMSMGIVRRGYRMIFEPKAISQEVINDDIRVEFKRRVRIGTGNYQAFFWLLDFLNPLRGWPFFCYVSHKVTRWFSPFIMLGVFLSSGYLGIRFEVPIFFYFFLVELLFIVIGLSYPFIQLRLFRPVYYFLLMNVALATGFFKYLRGVNSAIWTPPDRQV